MKLLTGLKALALSLTLSPVGRGNWSSGAAYSEVIEGPCLPEPPDSAAGASKQNSRIRALPPLPLGGGAGGEGPGLPDCFGTSYGAESPRPPPNPRPGWERELVERGRLFRGDRRTVPS